MKRLDGKVIIVSGGNGLIGRAIVDEIRREGGDCYSADIATEVDEDRGMLKCDVTNPKSVKESIARVMERHQRLDGLVNCAYPRTDDWGSKFEDIRLDSWKRNVDMQMNSLFYFCQQALIIMKEQRTGSVVNISSIYGVVGPDFSIYDGTGMTMPAAYSAIKGGIINLTRYLASSYGPFGTRVNCVSPGGIKAEQPASFIRNYENKVPLRRMGEPRDIALPVCFLLSEEARYVTGHNLIVDGGWTAV